MANQNSISVCKRFDQSYKTPISGHLLRVVSIELPETCEVPKIIATLAELTNLLELIELQAVVVPTHTPILRVVQSTLEFRTLRDYRRRTKHRPAIFTGAFEIPS